MMKGSTPAFRTVFTALSILAVCATCSQAYLVTNGDFSSDILYPTGDITSNWLTEDSPAVFWQSDEQNVLFTFLGDDDPAGLTLVQRVSLNPGTYTLSFDYTFDSTIPDIEEPPESDNFFAIAEPTFGGTATSKIATNSGETTSFTQEGEGRLTFTTTAAGEVLLTFLLSRDTAIPQSVATTVCLDNVQLSIVPVPGAAILGGLGLVYSGLRLRRRTGAQA
ncbi:MAG: hypothetical protein ACM3VT_20545 [Solirubrobacterales bacterium]